jgi:Elongation factor Tu GTP binding domain
MYACFNRDQKQRTLLLANGCTHAEIGLGCSECIARSLNAVVLERKMIQQEVKMEGDNIVKDDRQQITVVEPPVFELGKAFEGHDDDTELLKSNSAEDSTIQLTKEPGTFTRCEITIHRVETHLLDPSPISLAALALSSSSSRTADNSTEEPSGSLSPDDDAETNIPALIPPTKKENMAISETLSSRNIRVAVVGNVDAGKSTMIGTLTTSSLDDGRGKSRTSIMRHRHEIESGRTSTATTHLMGFRSTGEPITGKDTVRANKRKSEDEVARESYRLVTLMDLAGHEKYLKTT